MKTNKDAPADVGASRAGAQEIHQLKNNTFLKSSQITKSCRQESYIQRPTRHQVILDVLEEGPMTAREIAEKLGYSDLNAVKPRLTELKASCEIEAFDTKRDPVTGRTVAIWRLHKSDVAYCQQCRNPMQWTGRIWLTCEHCGQLQQWPVKGENDGKS